MLKNLSKKIASLKKELKQKYVGIDNVIDEVLFHIENWMRFKDYQESPYVVNLWGMTGTGKSSLIEEIVNALKMQDIYFPSDMGYAHNTRKDIFDFDNSYYDKDHAFFVFDEFQHLVAHRHREDYESENSRAVWNFLDNGKIDFHSSNYELIFNIKLLQSLIKKMLPIGFDVQYGRIHDKLDTFKNLVEEFNKKYPSNDLFNLDGYGGIEIEEDHGDIIPEDIIQEIFENILQNQNDRQKFIDLINQNDLEKIKEALNFAYYKGRATKKMDLNKSIVFVIGNLDDAYDMVVDIGNDHKADDLNSFSKDVGIYEVRRSLFRKYRPEQIGRLGNNHIIYPALSSKDLEKIIEIKLEEIAKKFKTNSKVKIEFDRSMIDLIYKDGVIPSQGARPVISTVNSYIRGNLNMILSEIKRGDKRVVWKCKGNEFEFEFFSKSKSRIVNKSILIRLKQSELKRKRDPEFDTLVGVHEAGHALVYSVLFGKLPNRIQISNSGSGGWNMYSQKKLYTRIDNENDITVRHAGRLAEEMIFGPEKLTAGGQVDISEITKLALDYYSEHGFGHTDIKYRNENFPASKSTFYYDDLIFEQAQTLIESQKEIAQDVLEQYKELLILIADEVISKRSLSKKDLNDIFKRNGYSKLLGTNKFSYSGAFEMFKNEVKKKHVA